MLSMTRKWMPLWSTQPVLHPMELRAASLTIDYGAQQLCAGLTDTQLGWSSDEDRWSIAQNLAHLRTTTEVFLPGVDAVLAASRDRALLSDGPFHLGLYGRAIVWYLESWSILKLQAPTPLCPGQIDSPAAELKNFLRSQQDLRQRMETAQGLHLTALRFPSPLVSCFRVNLLEFFAAVNAHARRHLRQASVLRQAMSLPQH